MSNVDLVLEGVALLASIKYPVLSAVFSGAKLTRGAIRKAFPDADDRVAEFIVEETSQAVFTVVPEIEKRVKQLEEKVGDAPSATQAALIWTSFVEGFARAEGKKRKLLLNALVNAFDPELYEQSMTTRLLAIMDDVGYGELCYLMELEGKGGPPNPWRNPEEIAWYHANQLVTHGLAHRHRTQGGVESTDDLAVVTGLGRWMVKLIRDPNTGNL